MNPSNQALAQLKDIHLPQAPAWWPISWPWWLMASLLLVAIIVLIWQRRKHAWRKQALAKLSAADNMSTSDAARYCNRLLKQIAVKQLGLPCGHLSGIPWLNCLDQQLAKPIFLPQLEAFAFAVDAPNTSLDKSALLRACEHWIRKAKC